MTGSFNDLEQGGPLNRVQPVRAARLPRASVVVRFMEKVMIQAGQCWIWTGSCNDVGYGYFNHPDTGYAHRAAYLLLVGPIPEGAELDHLCRNKSCVKPDHLEPVTARVNVRRAIPDTWTRCERLHPGMPTRLSEKKVRSRSRTRCLECHRVEAAAERQRFREECAARRAAQKG